MHRVREIKRAGRWDALDARDRVMLDADDRQRRRIVLSSEGGTTFLLDWEAPVTLRDGDALVLDNGALVRVCSEKETLIEIEARAPDLLRLAWHIGNRHADLQVAGNRLRIRRDHVLEEMVRGLGGKTAAIEAPFDPEPAMPHDHVHHHGA